MKATFCLLEDKGNKIFAYILNLENVRNLLYDTLFHSSVNFSCIVI